MDKWRVKAVRRRMIAEAGASMTRAGLTGIRALTVVKRRAPEKQDDATCPDSDKGEI